MYSGATAGPPGPAVQGPATAGSAVPEHFARQVDPNNQIQQALLQRLRQLNEMDGRALAEGISPQAAVVLKKILPEIAFIIDHAMSGGAEATVPGAIDRPMTRLGTV